ITHIPLSADLYGYSWSDIQETIISSGGISPLIIVAFVAIAVLIFSLPSIARRLPAPKFLVQGFYGLTVISIPLYWIFSPSPADFTKDIEYSVAENKLLHFTSASYRYFTNNISGSNTALTTEYPFLHEDTDPDVLGSFMTVQKTKPNIVIIIVEGLGRAFVAGGSHEGFTPFIDSLSHHSLYWKNFLSTTGRTFGVLPSLTASLPFGEKGFMELGQSMPDHHSLFTLLQDNGYHTSYYYGGRINFDLQNIFLERQKINTIIDEGDFLPPYEKAAPNEAGFSWGYSDGDLFKRSLQEIDGKNITPRLDVYMTISTHEPFIPPHAEHYRELFEERLQRMGIPEEERNNYRQFKDIYSSLLYTDEAIRDFISAYKRRSDYGNTIFMITGDHRLIPVPMDTKLDRYRVPFIIYSPMLNRTEEFSSVSTHADIPPTVIGFLRKHFPMNLPAQAHWIGTVVDTAREFRAERSRAFMPFKGEISDYLDGKYFLSGDRLFSVSKNLYIDEIQNDSIKRSIEVKKNDFIAQSIFAVTKNRIYPAEHVISETIAAENDDSLYARIDRLKLNSDQLFLLARDTAFKKYYSESRVICRRLLAVNPDYHDVRALMGRTFAWERRYTEATETFMEILRRSPAYSDAYFGLAQTQYWSGNYPEALKNVSRSVELTPVNIDARFLKATMLADAGRTKDAVQELDMILARAPGMQDAKDLRKKLLVTKR
ncbi:MAG: sulfatase-like hydrolase/transferase, partial [Bacteroidota bacterium]